MKHLRLVLGLVGCVCLFNYVVDGFPKRIPLGGIFPRNLSAGVTAFRYEVEKHNNSTVAMDFKLDRYEKIVNEENSQDLTGKICTTLFKGIFAFYGVTSPSTIDTVASYSHTLHMPYVSSSLPPTHTFQPSDYLFYMRPSYTQAMIGLIKYFKWSHVSYVYDDSEGLSRLLEVRSKLNIKISPTRLLGTENCYTALRKLDSQQKSGPKYIVLDLSSEEALRQVLRQILKVGMNRASYHYLLGVLAMDELDLKDFEHGGVNITGFRLVNPKNPQVIPVQQKWSQLSKSFWKGAGTPYLELDVAVAMDAVNVLVRSLSDMLFRDPNVFKGTFRRGQVYNNKTRGIHCFTDIPDPWRHGPSIAQSIRNVEYEGVTGRVAFDRHGHRRDFELEVMELTLNRKTERVGTWFSSNESLLIDMVDNSKDNTGQKTGNKTRIITSVVTPPYLMYKTKTDNNGDLPVGNDRFEGYCAELAKEIAKHCHFDYIIKPVADGKYGALLENGKWDGMVAELTNGVADLAIAPLTINSKRERVIDFSKPFMRLGISIMIKKPEKQKPGVFSFMDPLSKDIWGCIIVAYIGVSVVLFLVSRFSPYEWQIEDSVNGPSFTNDFTLLNSLWFSLGAFMRQGCDVSPRSLSGRIVGSVWWFFTLILISSYTANLAAFLTVERMLTPIESADDLAEQTEIQYGTLASGSTQDFFKTSKVAIYERMWNFMSSQEPSVFTKDTAEGVERVRNSKGKFAFLLESTMNEYHNQLQPCNTMKVGANLDNKGYGIATPLESDLRSEVNLAVLKLQENGFLPKLKKKWWIDKGECTAEAEGGSSSQSALTLSNVAGIFYILIGGLGLAMVVSLLEFLYKSKLETRRQKKALANSFRQKARMAARGTPEHENGGVGSRTSFPQYMSTMPITHSSDISLI